MILRTLLIGAIACLVTPATADFVESAGGGAVPDPGVLVSETATITRSETINDLSITLNDFDHTWVGDLVGTLTHVNTGTEVTIFNRVDVYGTSGSGDGSNMFGDYTFGDGGDDFWREANSGNSSYVLSPGMYEATDEQGNVNSLQAAFAGESTAGVWRLTIEDADANESGSFGSWQINFSSTIPEPTSLGVVAGLLGLAAIARRRTRFV
ncbi:MAG: proprotein convertase P-domain-containing protein [Planctomycetota bacterium]